VALVALLQREDRDLGGQVAPGDVGAPPSRRPPPRDPSTGSCQIMAGSPPWGRHLLPSASSS
jgi:hypothetical protein